MNRSERAESERRRTPGFRAVAVATALALVAAGIPARAQAQSLRGLPIIRDAETEQLLRDYTAPILRAAGLAQQNVQVVIINDRAFNAFVADGHRIFVNVGALMDANTPNEMIGVLAHETGHIAGGHLNRLREELSRAQTASIIALLLGLGTLAATAKSGSSSGATNLGIAALQAPQSVIERSLLSYVRAQEEQADKAGVKFLNATGQSPKGMYDTFKRLADKIQYSVNHIDPYLQTHPMPAERMEMLAEVAKGSPYWDKKDPPELQQRHDLMRAKLWGFIARPESVANRYPQSDTSLPARYARAIASYRAYGVQMAMPHIDELIRAQPNNPYFHELKGQALLEGGRPADSVAPLRHAVSLAPNATLIRIMLGQALVATENKHNADEAIPLLRTAVTREPDMPDGYSQLAMAYGLKGDLAEADLAAAQAAFANGDYRTARDLATRAKTHFPTGSPGWVRADDIVTYKPPPGSMRRN